MHAYINADGYAKFHFDGWDCVAKSLSVGCHITACGTVGGAVGSLISGNLVAAVQCAALGAIGLMAFVFVNYSIGLYETLRSKQANFYSDNPPSSAPDLYTRLHSAVFEAGFLATFELGRESVWTMSSPRSIESRPVAELTGIFAATLSNYAASVLLSREEYLHEVSIEKLHEFRLWHPDLFKKLLNDERLSSQKRESIRESCPYPDGIDETESQINSTLKMIESFFGSRRGFCNLSFFKFSGDSELLKEAEAEFDFHDQMTEQELDRKFRKLVLKCHPDKFPGNSEKEEEFKRLGKLRDELKICYFN